MPVERLKLVGNLLTRQADTSVDQFYKNCYPDAVDGENFFVTKRPGLKDSLSFTAGAGRGVWEWLGDLYSAVGDTVRKNSTTTTVETALLTTTGPVYFTELGGGAPALVLQDKDSIYRVSTGNGMRLIAGGDTTYSDWAIDTYSIGDRVIPTTPNGKFYECTVAGTSPGPEPAWPTALDDTIADGPITWTCQGFYTDIPTDMVDGIAFLDQYIFVMDINGTIWNSNLNDVGTWSSTDFITAEMSPDRGVAITAHHNYIVAFSEYTTEFFYDAANASASPLSKVPEAVLRLGCAAGQSVVQIQNTIFWVGQDRSGGKRVYKMEGTQATPISSKPIDRLLNEEGSTISSISGMSIKIEGHHFYILSLPTTEKTLVFDSIDEVWHVWSSFDGSNESYFTGKYFAQVAEKAYVQDEDNGKIYELDVDTYQDDGNTIKMEGVTDVYDGGTTQNKFMHRLEVVGDESSTSGDLSISITDDNYKSYSTARTVDLNDRAALTRLGRFQRRAFKYTYEADAPARLEAFDLTSDLGGYGQ